MLNLLPEFCHFISRKSFFQCLFHIIIFRIDLLRLRIFSFLTVISINETRVKFILFLVIHKMKIDFWNAFPEKKSNGGSKICVEDQKSFLEQPIFPGSIGIFLQACIILDTYTIKLLPLFLSFLFLLFILLLLYPFFFLPITHIFEVFVFPCFIFLSFIFFFFYHGDLLHPAIAGAVAVLPPPEFFACWWCQAIFD